MSGFRYPVLFFTLLSLFVTDRSPSRSAPESSSPKPRGVTTTLSKLPLRFESNAGQMAEGIRFVARKGPSTLVLGDRGATLAVRHPLKKAGTKSADVAAPAILNLTVAGGRMVRPEASGELATKTHYLRGNDRSKWRTDVPSYAKVTYPGVLDGVDLVYHGENGAIEYDFVVAPFARVDAVAMNVDGAADIALDPNGDLRIHTRTGDVVQARPVVYQRDARGARRVIESSYRLVDRTTIGFVVAAYDRARPLVIDPIIGFGTYLGGSSDDEPEGIAADGAGNVYLAGGTHSSDFPAGAEPAAFPTSNAQTCVEQAGLWEHGRCGSADAFVAKIKADGSEVLWMTYLGGDGSDAANAIALGPNDEPVVTGTTYSDGVEGGGFPLSEGPALNKQFRGGGSDGFLTHLQANGKAIVYSTLLRGYGNDEPRGVAVDASGFAFVAGNTSSSDGFLSPDIVEQPQERTLRGPGAEPQSGPSTTAMFVVKVNQTGTGVEWLNLAPLSGAGSNSANAIAIDSDGRAYVTGQTTTTLPTPTTTPIDDCSGAGENGSDAFIGRIAVNGEGWEYLTCLHGDDDDIGLSIALDDDRNAYVGGKTWSTDLDTRPDAAQPTSPDGESSDGFVVKLNAAGTAITYATYLGGDSSDEVTGIAVDSSNTAWVTGSTFSANFPRVPDVGPSHQAGRDAFISRINAAGTSVTFSQFYGGSDEDFGTAIVARGTSVFVAGATFSHGAANEGGLLLLPAPPNALQNQNNGGEDGFVVAASNTPLLISPSSAQVDVGGTVTFAGVGGSGGYQFTLSQNNSLGTVDVATGVYTAGNVGGGVDVVTVTDVTGITADATVIVGAPPATLTISPTSTNVAPRGSRTFTATGGTPPYAFVFASNASDGQIVRETGAYTAGPRGSVTDFVRVTDATGVSSTPASIRVGEQIRITPTQPATPPGGSIDFSATGGAGAPYTWVVVNGDATGASIQSSGHYTAGPGTNRVDTVHVTDALGNKASVQISVGGGLAISPDNPTTTTRGRIEFSAFGGSGSFTWALTTAPSGATIDSSSGVYIAGTIGNAVDLVQVTDSAGNSRTVEVTVGPALTILPTNATVLAGGQLGLSGAGGSGLGYVWSIPTNPSGATVDQLGLYTAGATAGTDTVRLTDSLGSAVEAVIVVKATTTNPKASPVFPGQAEGINIGGGGDEDCTCRAVGGTRSRATPLRFGMGLALALGLVLRRRRRR